MSPQEEHGDGLEGSLSPRRKALLRYMQRRPTNLDFPLEDGASPKIVSDVIPESISCNKQPQKEIVEEAVLIVASNRIEDASCVLENRLYLSSTNGARKKELLQSLRVSVIINCTDD